MQEVSVKQRRCEISYAPIVWCLQTTMIHAITGWRHAAMSWVGCSWLASEVLRMGSNTAEVQDIQNLDWSGQVPLTYSQPAGRANT